MTRPPLPTQLSDLKLPSEVEWSTRAFPWIWLAIAAVCLVLRVEVATATAIIMSGVSGLRARQRGIELLLAAMALDQARRR